MQTQALIILDHVLKQPFSALGTIERNIETKFIYFVLCALDWHPVEDIAFCFHIPKTKIGEPAKAAHAADFALKDEKGLCVVGDAKSSSVTKAAWNRGILQVRRYQEVLGTPLAFLTSGDRWCVFGAQGAVIDDFRIEDLDGRTGMALVDRLKPNLGKGKCVSGQVVDTHVWRYGLCPPEYYAPNKTLKRTP